METPIYKDGAWRLDDPKLSYLTDEQVNAYLGLENTPSYSGAMHDAERQLIEKHKIEIIGMWPESIALIDLGSGPAEKTVVKAAEGKRRGKRVAFHPVDVNKRMLEIAGANARREGLEVFPHNCLIEDFERVIGEARKTAGAVYLNFGATHTNFPVSFLDKLGSAMKKGDFLYVSTQLRKKGEEAALVATYSSPLLEDFALGVLRHAGFERGEVEWKPVFVKDTVEHSSIVKRVPPRLAALGMKPGDRIVTHNSRKQTLGEFKEMLSQRFEPTVWTNGDGSFAIAVCRKK